MWLRLRVNPSLTARPGHCGGQRGQRRGDSEWKPRPGEFQTSGDFVKVSSASLGEALRHQAWGRSLHPMEDLVVTRHSDL